MNLNIELSDDLGAVVKEQAQAQGISPGRYVSRVLKNTLGSARARGPSGPFDTGYGMWAKYGPAPSAEDIDRGRIECTPVNRSSSSCGTSVRRIG